MHNLIKMEMKINRNCWRQCCLGGVICMSFKSGNHNNFVLCDFHVIKLSKVFKIK